MEKGISTIAGFEFENDDIVLDFTKYELCSFKNCNIIYYGHGPYFLEQNSFEGCTWHLTGPAANGVQFLKQMYNGGNEGGKSLVDKTIENIRS